MVLGLCLTGSLGIMAFFALFAMKVNNRKNGFIRLHPPHILNIAGARDIGYNTYYLAGATTRNVYLGNSMNPARLLITNRELTDTQDVTLSLPGNARLVEGANLIEIDSPFIYLMEGQIALIMRGSLSDLSIRDIRHSPFFNQSVPVSSSRFIIRMFDHLQKQNVLASTSMDSPIAKMGAHTLERQVDGIFSTDGILNYDPASGRILYVYHYRNQLLCFDTALHQIYVGKTIDTISYAQISVGEIVSEGNITLSKPPLFVNRHSCVSDGLLFVHSNLMANNEDKKQFDRHDVVDVYSVDDGSYRFSFYVPLYLGKRLSSFRVFGNSFFVIYDHYLVAYRTAFPLALIGHAPAP
jgi:hypothetical protein